MQVFKAFFKTMFVFRRSIYVYLLVFMVLAIILGESMGNTEERIFQGEQLKVVVIDRDKSSLSEGLVHYVDKTQNLVKLTCQNMQELKDDASFGVIDYVLIIPNGFEKKFKNGDYEDSLEYIRYPQSASGYLLNRQLQQYLNQVLAYEQLGQSQAKSMASAESGLLRAKEDTHIVMLQNTNQGTEDRAGFYFRMEPYTLLMMLMVGIAESMVEFRKKDFEWRMKCSVLKTSSRNRQLLAAFLITGISFWGIYMVVAKLLYFQELSNKELFYYGINTFAIMMFGLSLTFFVSTFVTKDKNLISMFSNGAILAISFLSGIFVGQEYMSKSVLSAARFLPTYWYVKANKLISVSGIDTSNISKYRYYIEMELLFVLVALAAGLVGTKIRAQRE